MRKEVFKEACLASLGTFLLILASQDPSVADVYSEEGEDACDPVSIFLLDLFR